ncbi:helix-turn-helix domain-containing protein, partial [Klebsiella pneumoniae]|nr:helix-turn-helix domain-containing protein [Klebsiella pneumoniae]
TRNPEQIGQLDSSLIILEMDLETARKNLGLSQTRLAYLARASQSAVSRLERGRSCPPSAERRIRAVLRLPVPERPVADRIADLTVE